MRKFVQRCLWRAEWVCALPVFLFLALLHVSLERFLDDVVEPLGDRLLNRLDWLNDNLTKKDGVAQRVPRE